MKRLVKEFGKAFFIGVLIFIIVSLIEYANGYNVLKADNFWLRFGINQLYSVVLYTANAFYFYHLVENYKAKFFEYRNITQGIIGSILITIVSIFLLRFITEVVIFGKNYTDFFQNEKVSYYYITFLISAVVTSLFYVVYYYKFRQENKLKEQKIIAGVASAQFDALKNQLDPHFLFNSLNVLTSLIEENPEAATRFTTSLSKVYRYVLEQKNKELITLEEELKFAELYMSLLQLRFEDSIVFTTPDQLKNPDGKVVPLSLQLLLENAVKHNQVTPSKKLYITITESDTTLTVTNNLQAKQTLKESSGVGLKNIKQRYALLTSEIVNIEHTATEFKIAIPIITEEIKVMKTQASYISDKRYESAKEQVDKLKGFYAHFAIYLIFVPIFIFLNYQSNAGFPWAIFPIGGWGFGVAGHAADTFNWNPFFGKDWEQRKIRELLDKEE